MNDIYSDIPELSAEQANILRRKKVAEMIQSQSMRPLESQQIPGGYVVPTNPLLALGKLGEAYLGSRAMDAAEGRQAALGEKATGMMSSERQKIVDALTPKPEKQFTPDMMPGEQSPFGSLVESSAKNQTPQAQLDSLIQARGEVQFPNNQKWADLQQKYLEGKISREDMQQARADAAKIAAEAKLQAEKDRNDMLMAIAGNKITSAEKIAGDKVKAKLNTDGDKPMPTAALKMQQENVESLGVSSAIQSDMMKYDSMIGEGKLDLGLFKNVGSKVKLLAGTKDPNAINYGNFINDMEKMRNDSLRLNKGTQTEGDAIRAMNEILTNPNSPEYVQSRLKIISEKQAQIAEEKKANNNLIRSNYGNEPLDYSLYTKRADQKGKPAIVVEANKVNQTISADDAALLDKYK